MLIRFWGTRGSIASPGPDTVRYGGNTSCVELCTAGGTRLVLDAGTGLRLLGDALIADGAGRRGHLLIGHTHWDHIQGFPFFAPLFAPDHAWDVYAPRGFGASLRETLAGQMQYTYFPVNLESLGAKVEYHDLVEGRFSIDDALITARYLNHPALTLGYRVSADGFTVVYSSDHECHSHEAAMPGPWRAEAALALPVADRRHRDFLAGADLLIHDAQYTAAEYPERTGWGHSTVEYAVDLALAANVRRLALYHHDPRRSDREVDALVAAARQRVSDAGGTLEVFAAAEGGTLDLGMRPARSTGAAAPSGDARAEFDPALLPGRPVLIACGEAELAQKLNAAVEAEGLTPRLARTLPEALRAAADPLSAAIVDLDFGSAEGAPLCAQLRAASADLPIIAVESAVGSTSAHCNAALYADFSGEYARTVLRALLLRTRARWLAAPRAADEQRRLAALRALAVLDTPAEERFERITRLAARVFGVPVALISLVDSDRQWFKSRPSHWPAQTPRDQAFCAHAILGDETMVVPDTLEDDRFADNPLVTSGSRVRFYAGQPVRTADGSTVGTLCLIDRRPREFSAEDRQILRDLGAMLEAELQPG